MLVEALFRDLRSLVHDTVPSSAQLIKLVELSKVEVSSPARDCVVYTVRGGKVFRSSYLDEANVGALLAEALTADVEAVLADQTSRVGADAAVSTMLATAHFL